MVVTENILHILQERVKELTALHRTARILQDLSKPPLTVMQEVAALLPPAWQYPEITSARISFQELTTETTGFIETAWRQSAVFELRDGARGRIDVFYSEERPPADEGPFLKEERELIDSLAEMLRSYFLHLQADEALQEAHDNLERTVESRTKELQLSNIALEAHQQHLRRLTSELAIAEARERRVIAEDLHDHLGQSLAFVKLSISQFRGNAIFCGFEEKIDEIMSLLDQTIQYTRNLTVAISPPVLFDLGLGAALEWLGERFQKQHGLQIVVTGADSVGDIPEELRITLFKAVQELLANVVKHARATEVKVLASRANGEVLLVVADNGCGFDFESLPRSGNHNNRFGLFNIQERMQFCGGAMGTRSQLGKGTSITLRLRVEERNA